MMTPEHIQRIADKLGVSPGWAGSHWRFPCPVCRSSPVDTLVVWKRPNGWGMACHAGAAECTLSALNEATGAGASQTSDPKAEGDLHKAILRAQEIFRDAEPYDPVGTLGRHFRGMANHRTLPVRDAAYIRQAPASQFGDTYLIEALIDPYQLSGAFPPPVVLGVAMTHIKANGEMLCLNNGLPKRKLIGRRRGMACPIGDFTKWRNAPAVMHIGIGASATYAAMHRFGLNHALAVTHDKYVIETFLPPGIIKVHLDYFSACTKKELSA